LIYFHKAAVIADGQPDVVQKGMTTFVFSPEFEKVQEKLKNAAVTKGGGTSNSSNHS
jgi:hypothetical protein